MLWNLRTKQRKNHFDRNINLNVLGAQISKFGVKFCVSGTNSVVIFSNQICELKQYKRTIWYNVIIEQKNNHFDRIIGPKVMRAQIFVMTIS